MDEIRTAALGVMLWPIALLAALLLFIAWLGT
jgi:hypothetical protein